jgi:hypothetical protein
MINDIYNKEEESVSKDSKSCKNCKFKDQIIESQAMQIKTLEKLAESQEDRIQSLKKLCDSPEECAKKGSKAG